MFINHEEAKRIKEQYPAGTRIELISMVEPFSPVEKGTRGTVSYVDDAGQIHMKWDNGRTLAINLALDVIRIVEKHEEIIADDIVTSIYESDIVEILNQIGVAPSLDNIDKAITNNLGNILESRTKALILAELKTVLLEFNEQNLFKGEAQDE